MQTPVPDYLREVLDGLAGRDDGAVAGYIPELAAADPDVFGIAVTTVAGRTYSVGDDDREFSLQSVSKPFCYAAALTDRGIGTVMGTVGIEPSGEAFDELSLEQHSHRPRNPMINVGALATHHLLVGAGASRQARVDRVVDFCSELAGRRLSIDRSVAASEMDTADRNLALAHMLRNHGVIDGQAHDVVAGYVDQCSILVTIRDLAVMGATLANAGVQPVTGTRVVSPAVARQALSAMAAAGMYDAAGTWFADVGIPAKSGVSGGLLGALPGQAGIGVFSPRLDSHGNSVRGVEVFRRLSGDMGMHLMESEPYGSTVLRSVTRRGSETVVALQGVVQFTGAESVLHHLQQLTGAPTDVVIDLRRVDRFVDVGRRMVLEGMRRLVLDGHRVVVEDPEGVLPDPDLGNGSYPEIRPATSEL
jgi:glutaminase